MAFLRTGLVLLLLVLTACGKDSPTGPAPVPSLDGTYTVTWAITGTIADVYSSTPMACRGVVPLYLTDTNGTLSGSFDMGTNTCTVEGETYAIDWSSTLTGAYNSRTHVMTLTDGFCVYTGTIRDQVVTDGTIVCTDHSDGWELDFTGTWRLAS